MSREMSREVSRDRGLEPLPFILGSRVQAIGKNTDHDNARDDQADADEACCIYGLVKNKTSDQGDENNTQARPHRINQPHWNGPHDNR